MKTHLKTALAVLCITRLGVIPARAEPVVITTDSFGSGANAFSIGFAHIGNAGNADDAGAGGGRYFSSYGGVPYQYRLGTYEISQESIDKATGAGMRWIEPGFWKGNQPAAKIKWYDVATFVNWLNTSTQHQPAYNLTYDVNGTVTAMNLWSSGQAWQAGGENLYRHKDAYYFLPSEDEWYKAAYHKNDGVTANYWDFALGTNDNEIPDGVDFNGDAVYDAIFEQGFVQDAVAVTNVGLPSPYGTFGQNGHMWEWFESAFDGSNDSGAEVRGYRGGDLDSSSALLYSSVRVSAPPGGGYGHLGFRVASVVPEPTVVTTCLLCFGLAAMRRRR